MNLLRHAHIITTKTTTTIMKTTNNDYVLIRGNEKNVRVETNININTKNSGLTKLLE
jgi:hypothetical protein